MAGGASMPGEDVEATMNPGVTAFELGGSSNFATPEPASTIQPQRGLAAKQGDVLEQLTRIRTEYDQKLDYFRTTFHTRVNELMRDVEEGVLSFQYADVVALTKERDELKAKSEALECIVQHHDARIANLEERHNEKLSAGLKILNAEIAKGEEKDKEIKRLKTRVAELGSEKYDAKKEVDRLQVLDKQRVERLQDERKKKKEVKDELEAAKQETQNVRAVMKEKELRLAADIRSERSRVNSYSVRIENQEASIKELREKLEDLKSGQSILEHQKGDPRWCDATIATNVGFVEHKEFQAMERGGYISDLKLEWIKKFIELYNRYTYADSEEDAEPEPQVEMPPKSGAVVVGRDCSYDPNNMPRDADERVFWTPRIPSTGAESVGYRSRRAVGAFARSTQNRYNSGFYGT